MLTDEQIGLPSQGGGLSDADIGLVQPLNNTDGMNVVPGEGGATPLNLLELPIELAGKAFAGIGNYVANNFYYPKAPPTNALDKVLLTDAQQRMMWDRWNARPGQAMFGTDRKTPQMFEGGRSLLKPYFDELAIKTDRNPVEKVTDQLIQGIVTPEGIGTLPIAAVKGLSAVPAITFGGPMVAHAPETTAQAAQALGTVVGTPAEQRTPQMRDDALTVVVNEVAQKLFLGSMASHFKPQAKPAMETKFDGVSYPQGGVAKEAGRSTPFEDVIDIEAKVSPVGQAPRLLGKPPLGLPVPKTQTLTPEVREQFTTDFNTFLDSFYGGQAPRSTRMRMGAVPNEAKPTSAAELFEDFVKENPDVMKAEPETTEAMLYKYFLKRHPEYGQTFDLHGGIGGVLSKEQMEKVKEFVKGLGDKVKGMSPESILAVGESAVKEKEDRGIFALSGPRIALSESGFKDLTKEVDAKQLSGRVQNLLKQRAPGEHQIYQDAGVWERLEQMGKVSPEVAGRMMQESGPKVEVRKFGKDENTNLAESEIIELTHNWYDRLPTEWRNRVKMAEVDFRFGRSEQAAASLSWLPKEDQTKAKRFYELKEIIDAAPLQPGHSYWSSIAPKSEQDMPGYVEIAVTRPVGQRKAVNPAPDNKTGMVDDPKFPSSHNFPPNTLGFTRGYMETTPEGKKVFHVIEVQSDWMKEHRDKVKINEDWNKAHPSTPREVPKVPDPLLAHYDRLALKSAVEHAREQGADEIAISDAETAMMTEGHDQVQPKEKEYAFFDKQEAMNKMAELKKAGHDVELFNQNSWRGGEKIGDWAVVDYTDVTRTISQEGGMRLHYDKILQSVMKELSGEEGKEVSFGEHKMATDRKNLIFKSPTGEPKTNTSAKVYPIPKSTTRPSLFEKDKPASKPQYLYGGFGPILTPEQMKAAAKSLKELGTHLLDVYSQPMIERLGSVGGPVSKAVSQEARKIVSKAKANYGKLTPVLDPAKKAAAKAFRGGTTWIRETKNVTDNAAISNVRDAIAGRGTVPSQAVDMVDKLKLADQEIKKLGGRSGKEMDIIPNNYGLDVIRRGVGPAWDAWTRGVAKANNVPVPVVQSFFRMWKQELDKWGGDVANLNKISRDFGALFPEQITHIRPGSSWHEVLVADPFSYVEQNAARTSSEVAFQQSFPSGSGTLGAVRQAVMKELQTDRQGYEFDNLMRTLQGHPLDGFTSWWNAPDTLLGGAGRMVSNVVGTPIRAMVLTGNALTNLGEALVGGPAIFLGYKNVIPAMKQLVADKRFYSQLEMNGQVNRAMQNYSFDPNSPVRSIARQGANALRTVFLEQSVNEFQEAQAAASAKVMTDNIKAGKLAASDVERVVAILRASGMSEANARKAVNGDAALLAEFERQASSFLTAGHQLMSEKSRLGVSRLFNELFWFHSYPQMALNQFRSVGKNLANDIASKNWKQVKENATLMGRLFGGRLLQGAITTAVLALAAEWIFGLNERKQEAEDDIAGFMKDSLLASMGGPLYFANRLMETGGDSTMMMKNTGSLSTPVSIAGEAFDASLGNGKYEGRDGWERAAMFATSKMPGLKPVKVALAVSGLSKDDLELETAIKAFYRWRRNELGWRSESSSGSPEEDAKFRAQMKDVIKELENGGDWTAKLKGTDPKKASRSLYSRTILKSPEGKELTNEQLDALRKRIGNKLVDRLQLRDAMVRELARNLSDAKDVSEVKQPTGEYALDRETESKRARNVGEGLSKESVEFLKKNKVDMPSYSPESGFGKVKTPLSVEDGKKVEKLFVKHLDKNLKVLMFNPRWDKATDEVRKKQIREFVTLAREAANVEFMKESKKPR